MNVQKQIIALNRRVKILEYELHRRVPKSGNEIVGQIFEACAKVCGVTVAQITGIRRPRKIADARSMAIYFLRDKTTLTSTAIGALLDGNKGGNKHHSTIIYADQRVRERMASGELETCQLVSAIEAELAGKGNS